MSHPSPHDLPDASNAFDAGAELRFRNDHEHTEVQRIRLVAAALAFVTLAIVPMDLLVLPSGPVVRVLALRMLMVASQTAAVLMTRAHPSPGRRDGALALMWTGTLLGYCGIAATYEGLGGDSGAVLVFSVGMVALATVGPARLGLTFGLQALAAAAGVLAIALGQASLDVAVVQEVWPLAVALVLAVIYTRTHHERLRNHWAAHRALAAQHVALRDEVQRRTSAEATLAEIRAGEARRAREQWRSLVENLNEQVLIVEPSGQVTFSNREDTLDDNRIEHAVPPWMVPDLRSAMQRVASTLEPTSVEVTSPDQAMQRVLRLAPILEEGGLQQILILMADDTARFQLQNQLAQAQKMQAIGTLAGGVAHDFNNILTAILGACELGLDTEFPEEPEVLFGEIQEAARRAADLTAQLLVYSRKQVLRPKRVDLNELLTEMLRMVRRLIGEDVEVVLELSPMPCMVRVDPSQMQQVVLNLAVNARDAMPAGGQLFFSTAILDEVVRLEVRDTGTGMSEETRRRLFEPFFTTKGPGQGTGLGLSTVLGIVDQSGGAIFVNSNEGGGTTFLITLPHSDEPEVDLHAEDDADPPSDAPEELEILLVEDEPALRQLLRTFLTRAGHRVLIAEDLASAVALSAQCARLDLLLSDVIMPGGSGPEVARAVRAQHPRVRVLFISGYAPDRIRPHGVEEGRQDLLQKPFTRAQLLAAIDNAFLMPVRTTVTPAPSRES